jgi:hypothetical protein
VTLEQVLASAEAEAAVLRLNGHVQQADSVVRLAQAVRTAAADYLDWITEGAARLRSGRGEDYFKARRDSWAEQGLAERRGRRWFYRRCIIEHRKPAALTRAEARRAS